MKRGAGGQVSGAGGPAIGFRGCGSGASEERSMSIKSFRDLRVWQAAMVFVEAVCHLTHMFPKHEVYGLASQT
jgi:hypothetical protein